jgi:hypothetical protein
MDKNPCQPSCLLKGKISLLRMREETWLTDRQIAIVDRAIAAFDKLLDEIQSDDRSGRVFTHHHSSDANGIRLKEINT